MGADTEREKGPVLKQALLVLLVLACVAALAAAAVLIWKSEGRGKDNLERSQLLQKQSKVKAAAAAMKRLEELEALRKRRSAAAAGSPGRALLEQEVTEAQNLIAAQVPGLLVGRDAAGNAVIAEYAEARAYLQQVIDAGKK